MDKIEKLLCPRYKIIADYPSRPETMPVGHIITLSERILGDGMYWHKHTEAEPIHIEQGWDQYPHIFKKLKWWEYRTPEELPEYVRDRTNGRCIKTELWQYSPEHGYYYAIGKEGSLVHMYVLDPITAEEYEKSLINPDTDPNPDLQPQKDQQLCWGCNVRGVWEHRCHGGACQCDNPVCMEVQGRITHKQLMKIVNQALSKKR